MFYNFAACAHAKVAITSRIHVPSKPFNVPLSQKDLRKTLRKC